MGNIGIIGAGDLGASIAFFLAEQHTGFTFLYHDQGGIALGKSLDLLEAAPVRKYNTYVMGVPTVEDLVDKDIIVLALDTGTITDESSEVARARNAVAAVTPYLTILAKTKAPIVVATEPFDVLTSYIATVLPDAKERILSVGSYIDSIRLAKAIATQLSINSNDVNALVLGHHGGTLAIDDAFVSVSGIPVLSLLSRENFEALARQVQSFDQDFLSLNTRNYPYYGPAAAFVSLINSLLNAAPQILPLSIAWRDETIAIAKPYYVYGTPEATHIEEKNITYSDHVKTLLATARNEVETIVKELL